MQTAAVPKGKETDASFSTGARSRPGRAIFIILVGLGLAGLYAGWTIFWFMTDDAYIAFRYIENSLRGFGYVWNPPPFLPVEGYTSFLWVVLLEGIWRGTGIVPPESANWVALFFSGLTLIVSAEMVFQLTRRLPVRWISHVLVGLLLGYLLLNRSFLAWSSSGLETAMFGFFLILWTWRLNFGPRSTLNYWMVSLAASLAALTRPDGLLFAAATPCVLSSSGAQGFQPAAARRSAIEIRGPKDAAKRFPNLRDRLRRCGRLGSARSLRHRFSWVERLCCRARVDPLADLRWNGALTKSSRGLLGGLSAQCNGRCAGPPRR